jgi:flavin-dependent thymidylate synthase
MHSKVKIIGHTVDPDRITSSGARISTTKGDSLSIFENATNSEKNRELVKKVLASGHKSLVEHIYFNLAFVNVSAYVEQFMLEFRLSSFTVKSRRYVDFSNMGFVVPSFVDNNGVTLRNADKMQNLYNMHMSFLFREYGDFVEAGVPKEDARFLLPYSYKSNFYCTVNARELCNILYSMIYGRGKGHSETNALGKDLLSQASGICPFIFDNLKAMECGYENKYDQLANIIGTVDDLESAFDDSVELISYTTEPEKAVARAALIGYSNLSTRKIENILIDKARIIQIIEMVLSNRRPRELEQINFTFRINSITLAAITHLTRHRIQSIIIPPFHDICRCERFITPDTIKSDKRLLQRYMDAYAKTKELYDLFISEGLNKYEISYLYLSGNVIDITTTMNGRELLTFIGLRSCNRTQWETRNITVKMLNLLREVSPLLFARFGPRCYVEGSCPEGNMTCGKYYEIQELFKEPIVTLQ